MIITLNINRIKNNNIITEIFSWVPANNHIIKSNNRQIFFIIRKHINDNAIHKYNYKLIDINYFNDKIIYTYQYKNNKYIPELNKQIKINYLPVLGTKKCSNCNHRIIYKGKYFCLQRGIKLTKEWYKCMEWFEINLENKNVYRREPTRRYDKNNARVYRNYRRRKYNIKT